jgi:hypothetical protein
MNKDKQSEIKKQKDPNYIPYYSWKTREQSRKNLESIALLLHITDLNDWYRISSYQINQFGGGSIITKFGTLGNALQYSYPEYPWDLDKFSFTGKKSTQRWLYYKLKELLPIDVEIIEDFNHPDLVWGNQYCLFHFFLLIICCQKYSTTINIQSLFIFNNY